jgi:hypothetical protein
VFELAEVLFHFFCFSKNLRLFGRFADRVEEVCERIVLGTVALSFYCGTLSVADLDPYPYP